MGATLRKMSKTFKNYNIESRTAKHLDKIAKDKPEMAPRHHTPRKISQDDAYVNTDMIFKEKSEDLGNKLLNVKVDSHGPPPPILRSITSGPLPIDRKPREFSYPSSTSVKEGRANLSTILEFINLHQNNPQAYTAQDISREHKLKLANVEQVLEHFKVMKIQMSNQLGSQYNQANVSKSVQSQDNDLLDSDRETKGDKSVSKPELIDDNLNKKDGRS